MCSASMIGWSGPRRWSMTYRYAVSPSSSKTTWNGDGRESTTIASPGCNLYPSATPGGSVSFARASRRVAAVLVLRGLRVPLRRRVLELVFSDADHVYDYPCSEMLFEEFLVAPSKGRFVNGILKRHAEDLGWKPTPRRFER